MDYQIANASTKVSEIFIIVQNRGMHNSYFSIQIQFNSLWHILLHGLGRYCTDMVFPAWLISDISTGYLTMIEFKRHVHIITTTRSLFLANRDHHCSLIKSNSSYSRSALLSANQIRANPCQHCSPSFLPSPPLLCLKYMYVPTDSHR